MQKSKLVVINLLLFMLLFLLPQISYSQSKGYPQLAPKERINTNINQKQKEKIFFPDEYSDLDDKTKSNEAVLKNKEVNDVIEQARQKYYQALILIQKRDNKRATKYLEDALNGLNKLLSLPDIESNKEFAELAQTLLDEYKKISHNSNLTDENSPVFALDELLNKEIEKFDEIDQISLDSIYAAYAKQNPHKVVKTTNFGKLPKPPDSLQIPMDDNPIVQKSIDFLTQSTGKRFYTKWLERSARWFPMMLRIAREEGMPQEILYLSMIESGMNPNAVSSAKAVGLWQFMRATGLDYGLNAAGSIFVDERRDPEKATRAAMRHLRDLYQEFGDWHLALAAYNCGAGCVSRAIKKTDSDTINYWTVRERLPKETRGYIPKYISASKIAMDPESYGYKIDSLNFNNEYLYDTYTLNEPINLDAIAKCVGITTDAIKDLNPELLFNCTPPDILPYNIKIPKGSGNLFAMNYAKLSPEDKSAFLTHTVLKNESLIKIAHQYDIDPSDLATMNNLQSIHTKIRKGQEIKIPVTAVAKEVLAKETQDQVAETPKVVNTDKFTKHKIKDGETLFSIAKNYGMEVGRLRKINNIDNGDRIIVGSTIYVESELIAANNTQRDDNIAKKNTPKVAETQSIVLHKVRRGESLDKIAKKYNVSIADIRDWNGLRRDKINLGHILKIKLDNEPQLASNKNSKSLDNQKTIHKVESGESIGSIAKKYGLSESKLKEWNSDVVKGNTIFVGTRLKLYDSNVKIAKNTDNNNTKFYKVKRGDTLSEIAKKFGISTKQLKRNNKHLTERDLQAGVNIKIR